MVGHKSRNRVASLSSSGVAVLLLGLALTASPLLAQEEVLVAVGENWKYFKGLVDPGPLWNTPAFNDDAWLEGPTGIGYGDDDDATILDDMEMVPDDPTTPADEAQPGYAAIFCRKTFTVADLGDINRLVLSISYDDGFVAYINGSEATRSPNMPAHPIPFEALATSGHGASRRESFYIDLTNVTLSQGENLLAVEVRNRSLTSSDLSFIPELIANPVSPANDFFDDGQIVEGLLGRVSGKNCEATREPGEPFIDGVPGGHTLWWRWVAPHSEQVTVDTFGSDFDTLLGVYTGVTVDSLELVAENDDEGPDFQSLVEFEARAGTLYHFAVDGFDGECGRVFLAWFSGLPGNDNFADGEVLEGLAGRVLGTNRTATREEGEPDDADGGHSVWWRWVAPRTGQVTVFTFGSSFDTLLGIYTGVAVDSLELVAENDDEGPDVQSLVEFEARAGTLYHFAVDGFDGESGTVLLTWFQDLGHPPGNDLFDKRRRLEGAEGLFLGTNRGAGREAGEPDHAGGGGTASVWWSWVAPGDGTMVFKTFSSTFDTVLAVYTGTAVDGLDLIDENDDDEVTFDGSSALSFEAAGGTQYKIAVDGVDTESGIVALSWLFAPGEVTTLFRRGDVNNDDNVNLADGLNLLNFLFQSGPVPPTCQDAADCNDDGKIDAADPVFLLNFLFRGGPEPPPPFIECGGDPTRDELSCGAYTAKCP